MTSNAQHELLVDFNSVSSIHHHGLPVLQSMDQFVKMFPSLTRDQIELVLRKNDGDVAQTVDDLLILSENAERCDSRKVYTDQTQDDHALAVLIQNQEFLEFIKHDPGFRRQMEIENLPAYTTPPTRRHVSVLERCRMRTRDYRAVPSTSRSLDYGSDYDDRRFNDESKVHIPDGPLVDPCEGQRTRWLNKLKPKLLQKQPSTISPEDVYPHTVTLDYTTSDERFIQKVRSMSKSSKGLLNSLARKFLVSKDLKLKPIEDP